MKRCHNNRCGLSTPALITGTVLWLAVLLALLFLVSPRTRQAENDGADGGQAASSTEVAKTPVKIEFPARELPDFEFPECMGGTVSRDSLKGHVWIASFVFTRCVTTCPMITKEVMELHKRVGETRPDVRFVTFSVDSSYDTAEVLQKYAEVFSADHERWKFLTGDENEIHDLIRRGFTLYVAPNLGEARKPGFEVAHTNRVVLVNEDAIPVATFLATNPGDMARLRRILEGHEEFPQPSASTSFTISPADGAQPQINFQLQPVPSQPAEPESESDTAPADSKEESEEPASEEKRESAERQPFPPGRSWTDLELDGWLPTHRVLVEAEAQEGGQSAAVPSASVVLNASIDQKLPRWVARLPDLNAVLNTCSTVLLSAGYMAIRRGKRVTHRNLMITAFLVSVVFLGSYLTYHVLLGEYTGERGRRFVGSATATRVYWSILLPHVILAVFVPILAIRVFQHAFRENWTAHRKLARITFPIWMFVSVTGVVIYWMLYHWPWPPQSMSVAVSDAVL